MIRKISTIIIILIAMSVMAACGPAQTATPATSTNTAVGITQTATLEVPSATAAVESTITSTPQADTSTTPGAMQTPTPMGAKVEGQTQWDAIALQVAQAVGFTDFDTEIYQLPANTSWDSTLAYYTSQAAASGWGDAPTQTTDLAGGHAAVWSVNVDGTTHYFVVAQVDTADGSFTLNLLGQ